MKPITVTLTKEQSTQLALAIKARIELCREMAGREDAGSAEGYWKNALDVTLEASYALDMAEFGKKEGGQ